MTSYRFKCRNSIFGFEIIYVFAVEDFKKAREMAKNKIMNGHRGVLSWKEDIVEGLYDEKVNTEQYCKIEDGYVFWPGG